MLFVQDNQEESDQGREVSINPKSNHPESSKKEEIWPKWVLKCKDVIEVISIIGGIIFIFYSIWSLTGQVDQLSKQNEAISKQTQALSDQSLAVIEQTEAINKQTIEVVSAMEAQVIAILEQSKRTNEQTEALLFSERPIFEFDITNAVRDITICDHSFIHVFDYVNVLKLDSASLFHFNYSIKNSGQTPATIKSISNNLIFEDYEVETYAKIVDLEIYTNAGTSLVIMAPLVRNYKYLLHVQIEYEWKDISQATKYSVISKYYNIWSENDVWRARTITPTHHENLKPNKTTKQYIEFE